MKKNCIKCNESKSLENFSKKKGNKDGYNNTCKSCHSIYRREHYLKNKEKVLQQVLEYKKNNPDKYIQKFGNTKPNKKAGRVIKSKCSNPDCNIIVYRTKNDTRKNVYCSKECKTWNYHPINSYLSDIKKRVLRKDMEFDLNFEFLKDLLENKQNNKCAMTNAEIKFGDKTKLYETPSLDRIDNDKGYTKDNVQWVMLGINYMKMKFTNEDLIKTLDIIKENY